MDDEWDRWAMIADGQEYVADATQRLRRLIDSRVGYPAASRLRLALGCLEYWPAARNTDDGGVGLLYAAHTHLRAATGPLIGLAALTEVLSMVERMLVEQTEPDGAPA